jgi:LuxR family maltose regulon positive regulatory protein
MAERESASVPDARRGQVRLLLGITRLMLARQRGNLEVVRDEGRRLQAMAQAPDTVQPGAGPPSLGQDLRALALISLGVAELWSGQFTDGERLLEQGATLARQAGRPYLEFTGLAHLAVCFRYASFTRAAACARQAIALAERHGWTDDPAAGIACVTVGAALTWQGRLEEAERWVQRAERTLKAEAEPAVALGIRYVRGLLDLVRGRDAEAVSVLRAAAPLAGRVTGPNYLVLRTRALLVHALVRLGDTAGAQEALAGFGDHDPVPGEVHVSAAMLRLAAGDPRAATAALAPVTDGTAPLVWPSWQVQAFLLDAIARDAMGDEAAAAGAVERALDLAESDGALAPFLLHPAPRLLERRGWHPTSHAALVIGIRSLLSGSDPGARAAAPPPLSEPLSDSELRVLRYLPTNLTAPEIAGELSVSQNTVKTHMRNVYAKLGTHRRADTVARARDLGLLAPSTLEALKSSRLTLGPVRLSAPRSQLRRRRVPGRSSLPRRDRSCRGAIRRRRRACRTPPGPVLCRRSR